MDDTPENSMPSLTSLAPVETSAPSDWREWLQVHGPRMLLFARQQTRSHEDAQDILQDAIVKLVEKIRNEEFIGGPEAWQPYLYTAIRRLAIDLSRRDDRRKRREDSVGTDAGEANQEAFHPWFESESSDDETRLQLEENSRSCPKNLPKSSS
jgi:RNA polymerase sigma-70 factor, ECF subfamily